MSYCTYLRHPILLALFFPVFSGCVRDLTSASITTYVKGKVVNEHSSVPMNKCLLRIFDTTPRFSLFGIAGPQEIATATTDTYGNFSAALSGDYSRKAISCGFGNIGNIEAMQRGLRIVDLAVSVQRAKETSKKPKESE